jgi:hypothetical protein
MRVTRIAGWSGWEKFLVIGKFQGLSTLFKALQMVFGVAMFMMYPGNCTGK